jgi:hypothetical protein
LRRWQIRKLSLISTFKREWTWASFMRPTPTSKTWLLSTNNTLMKESERRETIWKWKIWKLTKILNSMISAWALSSLTQLLLHSISEQNIRILTIVVDYSTLD